MIIVVALVWLSKHLLKEVVVLILALELELEELEGILTIFFMGLLTKPLIPTMDRHLLPPLPLVVEEEEEASR